MCEKRSSIYIAVKTSTLQRSRWSVAGAASISSITASVLNDAHLSLKAPSAAAVYAPESVAVTLDCVNYTRSKQHCNISRLTYHIQPTLSSYVRECLQKADSQSDKYFKLLLSIVSDTHNSSDGLRLFSCLCQRCRRNSVFGLSVCVRDTDCSIY